MKKLLNALLILAITLFNTSAFADLDCRQNGSTCPSNPITGINFVTPTTANGSTFSSQTGLRKNIPVIDQNLFAAGVAQGDYTSVPSTTTIIPVGYTFVRKAATNNGDALYNSGTLPNGYPNQTLVFEITGFTGTGSTNSFTLTPTTSSGWTSAIFTKPQDTVVFFYVDNTIGWITSSVDNLNGTSGVTVIDQGGK